jgi:hypothetical protein
METTKPISAYLFRDDDPPAYWIGGLAQLKRDGWHRVEGAPISITRAEAKIVVADRRLNRKLREITNRKQPSSQELQMIEVNTIEEVRKKFLEG